MIACNYLFISLSSQNISFIIAFLLPVNYLLIQMRAYVWVTKLGLYTAHDSLGFRAQISR